MSNNPFKDDVEFDHFTWLDMTVVVLSIYVLAMLLVAAFVPLPREVQRLLLILDDAVCVVFLWDFFVRFRKAPNKWEFMKWGWIDFISSIPTAHFLHAGRAFRLLRLLRILRAFRSMRHLIRHLYHSRVQGTFGSVILIAMILVIFSSIVILEVETHPDSNIKTAEDAIWWSYVTITTIGYGDYYPVTTAGRLVAMVLMTAGVGLFGTFTAYVAAWFAQGDLKVTVKNPIRREEEIREEERVER